MKMRVRLLPCAPLRCVAQSGRVHGSEPCGRGFKSCHTDQLEPAMENDLDHAAERIVYGWYDPRSIWGSATPGYWDAIWMASSCCGGLQGPCQAVALPDPDPKIHCALAER